MAEWRPPPDYEEIDSAVEGVVLYRQRPTEAEAAAAPEAPRRYKCPACGATTGFEPEKGGVHCPYCSHTELASGATVGTAAEGREFTLEAMAAAEQGWGIGRRELHCESCGTDLVIDEGALSTTCPFCASNQVALRETTHETLRPRFVVPFALDPAAAARLAKTWMGKGGWLRPGGLAKRVEADAFTGVYLPFWTFSAALDCGWEADVGYETKEAYIDHNNRRKTRSTVQYRQEKGRERLQVDDLRIPGTGTLPRELLQGIDDFDLAALAEYSPDFLAGWQAQAYERTLPEAWTLGKKAMRERARYRCRAAITSRHVRNVQVTADFGAESWRYVLLPVFVSSFRFHGTVYRVLVNGQTGTVSGRKPVAWWKVWAWVALYWTPAACLGLIGLILAFFEVSYLPLVVAFALNVPAFFLSTSLYVRASRAARP